MGRRTKKIVNGKIKRYLWDGNVLLHQWEYDKENEPKKVVNNLGEISYDRPEPVQNLVTWVYEEGSFVPCAKIVGNEVYSVISNYLGTPIQAYDQSGNLIWERELDIYGQTRKEKGISNFVPFRYQGQYYDKEINLCYNRFRYYNPKTGLYISKDPIGLSGGLNVYAYVSDINKYVDVFGLATIKIDGLKIQVHMNDVDPWPSIPHGHIYDKGWVVDSSGNIFKAHKPKEGTIGQLSKKGKKTWNEFLENLKKTDVNCT